MLLYISNYLYTLQIDLSKKNEWHYLLLGSTPSFGLKVKVQKFPQILSTNARAKNTLRKETLTNRVCVVMQVYNLEKVLLCYILNVIMK